MALAADANDHTALGRTPALGASVVPLLALAVFINYVDRGNLATAAPLIKDQLHLDNTEIGILLSAFFWTYTPGLVLAGWLADKINAYRTLALGLALWSLATIGMGLAGGFIAVLCLRLALGLGESAAMPCSSNLLARHLPANRLGAANGMIAVGLALGPAVGTLLGGLLMARLGWRPVFMLFGLGYLLWLVPWLWTTRHASRRAARTVEEAGPPFWEILAQRDLWGAALGHFASNYMFYFIVSWLPLYLVKARGFSMGEMAEVGGVIYVIHAGSAQITGWLSDRWMTAGATKTRVYKTFAVVAHLGSAGCMLACAFGQPVISIGALLLSGVFSGFTTPTIFAIGQTLGGPRGGGKWIGVQNGIGNLAGILGPVITGYVVDKTGQFSLAFAIAAATGVAGAVGWGWVIRKVEPVAWAPAKA